MIAQQGFAKPTDSNASVVLIRSIVGWLATTFSSKGSDTIADAERHLEEASKSPRFVDNLTFIMSNHEFSSTQRSNSDEIRQAASTYLRRYSENVLASHKQSSINMMTDRLLKALSVPSIPMTLKRNIVSTLQHILVKDQKGIIRTAFTPNLISVLEGIVTKEQPNSQEYEYIVLFGVFMLGFPRYDAMAQALIKGSYRNYCQLVLRIIAELSRRAEESERWLLVLDEAMSLMVLFMCRQDLSMNGKLSFILHEPMIGEVVHQVLNSITLGRGCFNATFQSTHYSIHTENETLSNTIEIARILLSNKFKGLRQDATITESLQRTTFSYLQLVYRQSAMFIREVKHPSQTIRETLSKTVATRSLLNTIRSAISLLAEMLQFHWVEEFYRTAEFSRVLDDIVLPLLELSTQEKDMFMDDPENIVYRIGTLLDYHLLPQFRPDGFMDESVAVQLTLSQLVGLMAKHLHGWLPDLVELLTGKLISGEIQLPGRLQLIILLGLLCYALVGRSDLELVRSYLEKSLPTLGSPTNNIDEKVEKALIMLLFSRYVPVLKNPEFNLRIISCLLGLLNDSDLDKNQPALAQGAIESLYILLQMVKTNQISQAVFLELVKSLERLMFREWIPLKLFDVILEVFRSRKVSELIHGVYRSGFESNDTSDEEEDGIEQEEIRSSRNTLPLATYHHLALQTVKQLIDRIELELTNSNGLPSPEGKQLISKCWNIIREILCHPDAEISSKEFLHHGSSQVTRLYRYLISTEQYFDEDILLLNNWLLNRNRVVTEDVETLFQFLPKILHRNSCIFTPTLYELLLLILRFGASKLCTSVVAVLMLQNMCIEGLLVSIPDATRQEKTSKKNYLANQSDSCRAVLILEELLLNCSEQISQAMWDTIIDALCRRLVKHQFIKFSFLKSHIIACLGMCLLYNPFLTPTSSASEYIYTKLMTEYGCFDVSYSAKIYAIVACEVIKRYSTISTFDPERLFALYRTVLHLLVISYEKRRNKVQETSLVAQHLRKDEEMELPEIEQEQYEEAVNMLSNDMTRSDEFEYFRKMMSQLKCNNIGCFNELTSRLSTQDRQFVSKIYHIQTMKETGVNREVFRIKRT